VTRGVRRALPGPDRPLPVPATPEARALDAAWTSAFDTGAPFRLAEELARDGWTTGTVARLQELVDAAQAARSGVTRAAARPGQLAALLARTAHTLMLMAPLSVHAAFDWLRVLATEPVWHAVDRPGGLAYAGPGDRRPLDVWTARVPHRLAPLAYAAGLAPEEAARAGTLDEDDLRTLAALRGHPVS